MHFVARPPAREFFLLPGGPFSHAVEDYAVFSAQVRREIESALREQRDHCEPPLTDLRALTDKKETE